jgi:DNA-directed RNA polymerase II subunit RPB1
MLFQSALFAEVDYLKGVSENIAVGQMAPLGTGEFDVLVDMKKIELAQQTCDDDVDMNWMEDEIGNEEDELDLQSTPFGVCSPTYEQQLGIKTPIIGTPA